MAAVVSERGEGINPIPNAIKKESAVWQDDKNYQRSRLDAGKAEVVSLHGWGMAGVPRAGAGHGGGVYNEPSAC